MAHKDWCGKPCCECKQPCMLDEIMPCSPDCELLGENGMPDAVKCVGCDAYTEYKTMFGGDEARADDDD